MKLQKLDKYKQNLTIINDTDVYSYSTKVAEINNSQGQIKYTLCGYKPRARKNPFIVLNLLDKKKYIISEEKAERLFGDPSWKNTIAVKNFDERKGK